MFIWNFDDKRKTFMEILKKWFEFQLVIKKIIKTVESVSIFYNKIFHYWFFNFVIKKKKKQSKKNNHIWNRLKMLILWIAATKQLVWRNLKCHLCPFLKEKKKHLYFERKG